MAIILPVISYYVDEVILDYLLNSILSGVVTDNNSVSFNLNRNNNSIIDNNNNNKTDADEIDEFKEIENWAEEPWFDCNDVDVPEWAKIEGPVLNDDDDQDLVWADDPWVQTPLVDIPSWMMLPGIDFDFDSFPWTYDLSLNDDGIEDLIKPTSITNWSDEFYYQEPLDVPRWAILPGIDFPSKTRNSPYWQFKINDYYNIKDSFRQRIFNVKLTCITE